MSIDIEHFLRLRPYLYHLTSAHNIPRLLRSGRLESAAFLMQLAKQSDAVERKRRAHLLLHIDGEGVVIRDQSPLHEGNMELPVGWTLADFVSLLNSRVFFWPGTTDGPISYGVRHYDRYADEQPAVLRVATGDLLATNPTKQLGFCRYNSGSPRCSNGRKSPRNSGTFVCPEKAGFRAAEVVEVTFSDMVRLPPKVELGPHPRGPWRAAR